MGGTGTGLHLTSAPITLQRSIVTANAGDGIYTTGTAFTVGADSACCNRIEGNGGYELRLGDASNVNATYNWWGSDEESAIQAEIYDDADNPALGIATYAPWSHQACSEWPIPEPFHLIDPPNGERVLTLQPTFDWEDASGGQGITYDLELDTEMGFPNPIRILALAESHYTLQSPLTDGQTYYWRVRARNNQEFSRYSLETRTVLPNVPPTVPDPIYPANGAVCVPEWYLVWLKSTDLGGSAITYRVQIDDDPGFGSPEIDQSGITAEPLRDDAVAVLLGSLEGVASLVAEVYYYWRVQAYDFYPDGSGFSTESIRFYYLDRASGVGDWAASPAKTVLSAVLPSVASGVVHARFGLATSGHVELDVYDVSGRCVRRLLNDSRAAGYYEAAWDLREDNGKRVCAGAYWIRMRATGVEATKRVIVVD